MNQGNNKNDNSRTSIPQLLHDSRNDSHERIQISSHAIHYATDNLLPSIKFVCIPKLQNSKDGGKIVQELIKSIETNFQAENKNYSKPLAFDLWYAENLPLKILETNISMQRPKNFPAQFSVIVKKVPYEISIDDVRNEFSTKYLSIFVVEELLSSRRDRTRHIRIDLTSKDECETLLNAGEISIQGLLHDVDEYFPADMDDME
ncbi:unnamed protein product [Didymodactylos carnosus]|uniref:Uncharacterized protein n=1 Tax=Didymodactylos carnosus TaxID=1234261 RepID=A0A814Y0R7_9BILA|nr:unnamed protein product [Didymodactylos carnosus]CAF1383587.1 unnamed protein product [Didymodactylos carnosus]CAF3986184.1 unnamed protein product [Didymodactylos carnosus]CAF4191850.1 unnamed protein product [Didymodactylos carnosus]